MSHHDPRIDAYIAKFADFARPILEHLRATVHAACPAVEEGLKWSMPFCPHSPPWERLQPRCFSPCYGDDPRNVATEVAPTRRGMVPSRMLEVAVR